MWNTAEIAKMWMQLNWKVFFFIAPKQNKLKKKTQKTFCCVFVAHTQSSMKRSSDRERQHTSKSSEKFSHISRCKHDFVEEFMAACSQSDVRSEKMKKLLLFQVKHCKQGGAWPERERSLCQTCLPSVFKLQKIHDRK